MTARVCAERVCVLSVCVLSVCVLSVCVCAGVCVCAELLAALHHPGDSAAAEVFTRALG